MKTSIVIPLFNKSKYLKETLNSVANSFHYSNLNSIDKLEIVIVDDGSTDTSFSIAEDELTKIKKKYGYDYNLIYQRNQGVSSARNNGIRASTGDYICFLDADDILTTEYFDFIKSARDSYPNDNVYATNYDKMIGFEGLHESELQTPIVDNIFIISDIFEQWISRLPFCASSVCFRRHFLIDNDLSFPVGENSGEDLYLWILVGQITRIIYTDVPCVKYMVCDENSLSFNPKPIIGPHVRYLSQLSDVNLPRSLRVLKHKIIADCFCELVMLREFKLALDLISIKLIFSKYIFKVSAAFLLGTKLLSIKKTVSKLRR